jgi:RNA polymerase sigma-70 factor (ECF subfamily)
VALSQLDRQLLDRCLAREPRAWEDFVDRFMGLVVYVINHSAQARSLKLTAADREDLCAEVFLGIIKDNFGVLRRFRGQSSLATYLTVVARRIVVREVIRRKISPIVVTEPAADRPEAAGNGPHTDLVDRISDREEVERLLEELDGQEAAAVRMYHLEGKSYREIAEALGLAENSIGPALSRARERMRQHARQATG